MDKRLKEFHYSNFFSKNHRGQVTIFIILAILIVAGISLYFILRENQSSNIEEVPEIAPVVNFVQECFETSSEEAIYFAGQHGGYYFPEEPSTDLGVPFYFYRGERFVPGTEKIEGEISKYIEDTLEDCSNNFTSFEGFDIEGGEIKVLTKISNEKVSLDLEYPLSIRIGEEVSRIERFDYEVPVRLGIIYKTSEIIIDSYEENPGEICIICLSEIQEATGIKISLKSYDDSVVYRLVDSDSIIPLEESLIEDEPYIFKFATDY